MSCVVCGSPVSPIPDCMDLESASDDGYGMEWVMGITSKDMKQENRSKAETPFTQDILREICETLES